MDNDKPKRKLFDKGYYGQVVTDEALRTIARVSLDKLSQHVSFNFLEQLMGLSQGYLSSMHSGRKTPSRRTAAQLHLMSLDPLTSIAGLIKLWPAVGGGQSSEDVRFSLVGLLPL